MSVSRGRGTELRLSWRCNAAIDSPIQSQHSWPSRRTHIKPRTNQVVKETIVFVHQLRDCRAKMYATSFCGRITPMCGRITLRVSKAELAEMFKVQEIAQG